MRHRQNDTVAIGHHRVLSLTASPGGCGVASNATKSGLRHHAEHDLSGYSIVVYENLEKSAGCRVGATVEREQSTKWTSRCLSHVPVEKPVPTHLWGDTILLTLAGRTSNYRAGANKKSVKPITKPNIDSIRKASCND